VINYPLKTLEFSSHPLYHVLLFRYVDSTSWYIVLLGVLPFNSVPGSPFAGK
jgi:hypothetical protein